ncbi:MAG: hypothetical protein ACK40K_04675, partial [Raineya sp.]
MKTRLLILAISFLLIACNFQKTEVQYAKKGIIDLRQSSLKNISLKGEFAFAWQKVATPAQMKQAEIFLN